MVANIVRRIKPQHRLKAIWALASKKNVCETDPVDEDDNGDPTGEEEYKLEKGNANGGLPKGHGGCGHLQPSWRKEALKLSATVRPPPAEKGEEPSEPEKRVISPGEIHNLLKKIPAEDLHIMGLNAEYARPDWMILTVLPVPPAAVRPSISIDGGAMRSEDDLTYKLAQILKMSANVRRMENEGVPPTVIEEQFALLQFHVATYMDNEIAGIPQDMQKSGRPVKAIRARLKGKEGRLRGNLMGKRVDFSARTVITGDPNLQLDQVGVPKSIAMTLTYPERGECASCSYPEVPDLTGASHAVQHCLLADAREQWSGDLPGSTVLRQGHGRASRPEVPQVGRAHQPAIRLDRREASQRWRVSIRRVQGRAGVVLTRPVTCCSTDSQVCTRCR
jgi:DNA-directed RNA polymerase II subunit RPB1